VSTTPAASTSPSTARSAARSSSAPPSSRATGQRRLFFALVFAPRIRVETSQAAA
jgi:hypothetical protein